jgi:hypothetical protein
MAGRAIARPAPFQSPSSSSSNSSLGQRIGFAHLDQRLHETRLEQQVAGQRAPAALEHTQRAQRVTDGRGQLGRELLRQPVQRPGRRDGQHVDRLVGHGRGRLGRQAVDGLRSRAGSARRRPARCHGTRWPSHGRPCCPASGRWRAGRLAPPPRPGRSGCPTPTTRIRRAPRCMAGDSGVTWRIEPSPKCSARPSTCRGGREQERYGAGRHQVVDAQTLVFGAPPGPRPSPGTRRGSRCGRTSSAHRWCSSSRSPPAHRWCWSAVRRRCHRAGCRRAGSCPRVRC